MKTITLDEEAYERLRGWKRMKGDSFSKVVKRIVPLAGTLGSMEQFARERQTNEEKDAILESSIEDRNPGRHEPWT